MIPLSLHIKGLYSYQAECFLDFTRLTGSGLFGIFGPVGSGKSAILEAITFALYGNTERLGPKDKRSYNMMNLKSNELFIEFIFNQEEDRKYKFCVQAKRNKKSFDKIDKFERTAYAYEEENDTWLPIQPDSAEEIIGLNYINFHKTVIIPQGRFHEFLYMTDSDRTRMLQDIFNLDKYDLYKKTSILSSQARARINTENVMLEKLNHATRDAIKNKESQLEEYRKAREEALQKQQELEEKTGEARRLGELFGKIEEARKSKEALEAQQELYSRRKEKLASFKKAYTYFNDILGQQQQILGSIAQKEKTLALKKDQQEKSALQIDRAKEQARGLKESFENRDNQLQQVRELETIASLADLENQIGYHKNNIERTREKAAFSAGQLESKKKERTRAAAKLEQFTRDALGISALFELDRWYGRQKNLKVKSAELKEKITGREAKLGRLEEKIVFAAQPLLAGPVSAAGEAEIEALLLQFSEKISEYIHEKENLAAKAAEYEVQEKLAGIAADLEEGSPCPLCGSTEHPAVLESADTDSQLTAVREKMRYIEQEEKTVREVNSEVSRFKTIYTMEETALMELKTEQEELDVQMKKLIDEFSWTGYTPEEWEKFQKDFREAGEKQEQLREITQVCEELDREINELSLASGNDERELNSQTAHQALLEGKKQTLTEQLEHLRFEDYSSMSRGEIEKISCELKEKLQSLEEAYSRANEKITALEEERLRTEGEIGNLQSHLEETRKEAADLEKELLKRVDEQGFTGLNQVRELLERPIEVEGAARDLDRYYQELHTSRETYRLLVSEAEGRSFDEKQFQQMLTQLNSLKEQLDSLARQTGETTAGLEELQKDIKEKKELEASLTVLKKREGALRQLQNLFKGSGFVNYVSKIFLQELCYEANKRFQVLTRRQLHLELTGTNSFQVRDYLNDGQCRSIKTLSGGQVFQASLSLALALSSHIKNRRNISQSFFFIDEGFGTQDSESLQLVFESLQSLRKEGRTVGVISHVDELKQEIDTFLAVSRDEKKGSLFSYSYE